MSFVETTKMSSKGQVVIPKYSKRLSLKLAQPVLVGDKDVVILKSLSAPSMSDFDNLLKKPRNKPKGWINKAHLKEGLLWARESR